MAATERCRVSIEQPLKNFSDMYSHDLQLYHNVPFGEIMLDELQEISKRRLKVLTLVEQIHLRKSTMTISQRKAALVEELYQEGMNEFAVLVNSPGCKSHMDTDIRARRRDHISHFLLRSTVAFNELRKRWFFKQETRLFKWRFSSLDTEGIKQFMRIHNFHFMPINQNEKNSIKEYLQMSSLHVNDVDNVHFYKVPFSHVTSLVKKRGIFIMQGDAFISEKEMVFVFVPYFRKILISGFESARETRANLYNDERFTRVFADLENSIHIESAVLVTDKDLKQYVSLNRLDKLSEITYPLCMRVLHNALRKSHHLTHGGRVQYGLFLKGIGISLSDAMTFWKNEFTKIMDESTFKKEHSYQIRFAFGWEGSRRDYQPFTCLKIMESVVGPRDYHGCPFKHMPRSILENELANCGFNALEISAIIKLSENGQYFAACNKYYEMKHGCFNNTFFKHPNIYFNESMNHHYVHRNYDMDLEIEDTH